jgi:hypothetical protein
MKSKLIWKIGLYTPISLTCSIKDEDRMGSQNFDPSILILDAGEKVLPRVTLLNDIKLILGTQDYETFNNLCKRENDEKHVLDFFDLGVINNGVDSESIVLKLKTDNLIYDFVNLIRKGIGVKFNINTRSENYTPYISLVEISKGSSPKYVNNGSLLAILRDSKFDLEDLALAITDIDNIEKDYYLTQYKAVDRYFRIQNDEKDDEAAEEALM